VAVDRPPELLLRAYRQWYGLDQMQAATRLADLGEAVDGHRPGVTNEMISRWECGASRPGSHYRRLLCALYQVSEAHLGLRRPLPGEIVVHPWDRLDDDHQAVAAWTMEGAVLSVRAALEADMRRRTVLAAAGAAVTRPAHDWLLAAPLGAAPHTTGTSLPAVVDHLDGITRQLRRMDDQLGGGGGLQPVVRQHLAHVIDLIEHRRYPDTLGRRLHSVAAELARLAGWTSFDAGVHGAAQFPAFVYCTEGPVERDRRAIAELHLHNVADEEFHVPLTPTETANLANALTACARRPLRPRPVDAGAGKEVDRLVGATREEQLLL
jgi:hypothetical protein